MTGTSRFARGASTTIAVVTMLAAGSTAALAAGASTTTALRASTLSAVTGQPVNFSVLVRPAKAGPVPTGSVSFTEGATALGSGTLATDSRGIAATSLKHAFLPGTHSVTATYGGDGNYAAGSPQSVTVTVSRAATSTSVSDTQSPKRPGHYTLLASVKALAPGKGVPSGTAGFVIDGAAPVTATLSAGRAHVAAVFTPGSSHTIKVTYGGDANFTASAGSLTFTA